MEQVKYAVILDVKKGGSQQKICGFYKGESKSREMEIVLIKDSEVLCISGENAAIVYGEKSDGSTFMQSCEVSDGKLIFQPLSSVFSATGDVCCQIQILSSDGTILFSPEFTIEVSDTVRDSEALESTDEFTALDEALKKVQNVNALEGVDTETLSRLTDDSGVLLYDGKPLMTGGSSILEERQRQEIYNARVYIENGELYIECDEELLGYEMYINGNGELILNNNSRLIDFEVKDKELLLTYAFNGYLLKETYDPRGISKDVYEYADEVGESVRKEITSKAEKTEVVPRFNNGFGMGYTKHRRLHVKGTSGSDDNDGITESTAIKTLDKFFSLLNEGYNDLRCYIEEPGVYDINRWVVLDCAIHITATVPGVTINFTSDRFATPWYNTHPNFRGVSASEPLTVTSVYSKWYIENSQAAFQWCKFDTPFENYGGGGIFNECTFNQVGFYNGSVGYIRNPTFTGTATYFVTADGGSRVTVDGTLVISDGSSTACAHVSGGSELFANCDYHSNYPRSLKINGGIISGSPQFVKKWLAKAVKLTNVTYNTMSAFEDLSTLETTDKTGLVNAINELVLRVQNLEMSKGE